MFDQVANRANSQNGKLVGTGRPDTREPAETSHETGETAKDHKQPVEELHLAVGPTFQSVISGLPEGSIPIYIGRKPVPHTSSTAF